MEFMSEPVMMGHLILLLIGFTVYRLVYRAWRMLGKWIYKQVK